jgi:hypothetical protein
VYELFQHRGCVFCDSHSPLRTVAAPSPGGPNKCFQATSTIGKSGKVEGLMDFGDVLMEMAFARETSRRNSSDDEVQMDLGSRSNDAPVITCPLSLVSAQSVSLSNS